MSMAQLEWVQNLSGWYWPLEEVNQKLKVRMETETEAVWETAQKLAIDLRTAAYVQGLNKLGVAMDAKGTRDYFSDR